MTIELQAGDEAPAFSLPSVSGESVSGENMALKDFYGQWVVLYFYPKDDTPGCTKESCSFRDNRSKFAKKGAVILGISRDDLASHEKFAAKFQLNFPLLSDADGAVCEKYGVLKMKKNDGKEYMGIERSTFLIDPSGKVAKVWRQVQVDGHDEAVFEAIGI